jgi:hypothetical protein
MCPSPESSVCEEPLSGGGVKISMLVSSGRGREEEREGKSETTCLLHKKFSFQSPRPLSSSRLLCPSHLYIGPNSFQIEAFPW